MAITPPAFKKDAVPSLKGWHHPKTGELLKSTRHTQSQLDEHNGVTSAPAPVVAPVVEAPALAPCPDCDDEGNCTCDDIPEDLEAMTKVELEVYARENLDVELDRRKGKKSLLKQVANIIKR
jgi:hypothetical protein